MKVEDIDRFLDRWRATLPPAFTPEYIDGFMRRHRGELHGLVLKTLARRGAEGGEAPELLADFLRPHRAGDHHRAPGRHAHHRLRRRRAHLRRLDRHHAVPLQPVRAGVAELQDALGDYNDRVVMPRLLTTLGIETEDKQETGDDTLSLAQAKHALRQIEEADRFW